MFNVLLQYEIPFNSPLVAPPAGQTQYTPDQVHVTLGGEQRSHSSSHACLLSSILLGDLANA